MVGRKPGRKDWSQCMPDSKAWVIVLCVRNFLVGVRKKILRAEEKVIQQGTDIGDGKSVRL